MKKVSVSLPEDLVKFIDKEAALNNCSRTEIIQNMLEVVMYEIMKADLASK